MLLQLAETRDSQIVKLNSVSFKIHLKYILSVCIVWLRLSKKCKYEIHIIKYTIIDRLGISKGRLIVADIPKVGYI